METKAKFISYADDTTLLYQGAKWQQIKEMMEEDINKKIGLFTNFLQLMLLKYTLCQFLDQLPPYDKLTFNNSQKIAMVKKFKYLGVVLESLLKCNACGVYRN